MTQSMWSITWWASCSVGALSGSKNWIVRSIQRSGFLSHRSLCGFEADSASPDPAAATLIVRHISQRKSDDLPPPVLELQTIVVMPRTETRTVPIAIPLFRSTGRRADSGGTGLLATCGL